MVEHHSQALPFAGPTPLDALLERAAREPDRVVLIADGELWSCARLAGESARLAAAFRACGLCTGDRVALHMFNRIEFALAYLACWRTGVVAVPLNTRHKAPELAAIVERVRPALYLGEASLYAGVVDIGEDVLSTEIRFLVGSDCANGVGRSWDALLSRGSDATAPDTPSARDAPAMLLATSGTTGLSKLVVWTGDTLAALAPTAADRGAGPHDIFPLCVPMAHASGALLLSSCMLSGATAVLLPRFDAELVLQTIVDHRCTAFGGLPFMFSSLVMQQRSKPKDMRSLRLCFAGGDICLPECEKDFEEAFGRPLLSFWVATETPSCSLHGLEPGPLTRFQPGTDVVLVDEAGELVLDGETGQMLVRSPGTTPGYWLAPGQIEAVPDGYFRTGDLVRREPDGQFRYMGRLKDLIVRSGSNISPIEVEDALRRQPQVTDVGVAGLHDPELGQRVGAALVLTDGMDAGAVPAILAGVRRILADYKVPERIAVVHSIPRNTLAKVDRNAVAQIVDIEGRKLYGIM